MAPTSTVSASGPAQPGLTKVDATSGNLSIQLPDAASVEGELWAVKKEDSTGNTVTMTTTGGDTIDGAATAVLDTENEVVTVLADDGTDGWAII